MYTNKLESGLRVILHNEPCIILETETVKPGKGQGFIRIQVRSLISNKLLSKTLKTGESIKLANVLDINLVYLYSDSFFWYFYNSKTLEQFSINENVVKENKKWLSNQDKCVVTFWNNEPIIVYPPKFVKLKVVKTDPVLKFSQVNSRLKLAELSTGVIIKVPFFIEVGEWIKVNTKKEQYVSRIL